MSTHRSTWKAVERRVAAFFNCRRQVCSGSSGRDDRTTSDSTHEQLYIETKLRESHSVRTLYDEVRAKAKKEGKVPVLCLADKQRPGFLIVVHCEDFVMLKDATLDEFDRESPLE